MIDQYYTGIENTLPTMEEYTHTLIEKPSGTSIESSPLSLERNLNSVSRRFVEMSFRKRQVNQEEIGDVLLDGITNFRKMSELLEKKFIDIGRLDRDLTSLSRLYNIRRESEVFKFLDDKPSIISLVLEAHERIRDYFGSSTELVLEVITDPEATEDYELVIFVRTSLSPDDAFSMLEQLDEEWWLDASSDMSEKLCIHMEFE
ncbi:hypothetical protein C5S53_03630 [Methanophagales archaeon]|nr:hypothetical protein C5S53_03630 [Methanophagales archaeon]